MGMKAASDSNELVFTLRTVSDPRNAGAMKSFADDAIRQQKRINDAVSSVKDGKNVRKAADDAIKESKRGASEIEKEEDRLHKRHRQRQLERAKRNRAEADDAIREAKRAASEIDREEERLHQRHRQRQLSRARRNRTSREESASNFQGLDSLGIDSRSRNAAPRMGGGASSFGRRASGIGNLVSGATNLASGFALSGMVGEKDSQKILDTIMKVEGMRGMVTGGLQTAKGLHGLGVLGMRGAGAAGAGGGGLGAGGVAAGAALTPISAFVLAVAGAAAAINGIKRQITGEANHPDSYEMKIGAGTAKLGTYGYRAGRALSNFGGSMGLTKENTRGLMGPDDLFSNSRNQVESEDRLASQQKMAAMKNDPANIRKRMISDAEFDSAREHNALTDRRQTENFKLEASTIRNPKSHSENNEETLDKLHTELAITNDLKRKAELKEKISALDIKGTSRVEATYGTEAQRQQRSYHQSQGAFDDSAIFNKRAEIGRTPDEGQRNKLGLELVELENRRAEMIRDDLQLERDIARTKIDATKEAISGLKQQRDIQISIYKEAEDKLKSAAEKFADLNVDEKSRLFRIKGTLDAAKNNPMQAEQIRSTLTKEDRQLARSSGLGDLQEGADQSAREKAKRDGFGLLAAGGAEARQAQAAAQTAMKIEATLKDEREMVVRLERDDSKLVDSLVGIIKPQLDLRDAAMRQDFANKLGAVLLEITRASNQHLIEGARSMR